MEEKKLEEMMQFEDQVTNQEIAGKIKKGMGKTIYAKLGKSFLVIFVILAVLCFSAEKFVVMDHYDPLNDEDIPILEEGGNHKVASFHLLMYVYTNLSIPGMVYVPANDYEYLGWGNYTLNAQLHNAFEPFIFASSTPNIQVNQSKLKIDGFTRYVDMFVDGEEIDVLKEYPYVVENKQKDIEEINKLPDTSYFDVAISLNKKISLTEFVQLINTYANSSFMFATTRAESDQFLGFSLFDHMGYGFDESFNQTYPNLILSNTAINEEVLFEHYTSMLKLINDHEEFKRLSNTLYDYSHNIDFLEEYEKAMKDGVSILGYRVHASKADLLKMLAMNEFDYYHIYDVKYSSFEH